MRGKVMVIDMKNRNELKPHEKPRGVFCIDADGDMVPPLPS
jgi:hypothetical protein